MEVAFDLIAPKPAQFWTLKSDGDVGVAVGRSGATRVQTFRLGRGVAQHALVAGKTGSGKSTLLHALISNLAMWYSPDEVELYLIDFKKGVEFKTYAMHHLPHARAIAVESDREFGLSVLQRIDVEMTRRAELFRPFKSQNLQMYREASGKKMPRTMLIIDEFQEFFTEDDKLSQDAGAAAGTRCAPGPSVRRSPFAGFADHRRVVGAFAEPPSARSACVLRCKPARRIRR